MCNYLLWMTAQWWESSQIIVISQLIESTFTKSVLISIINSSTTTQTCEKSRNPYSSQGSMSSTRTVVHVPSLQSRTWYAPSWHMLLVIITRSTNSGRSASTARALKNLWSTPARVWFEKSDTLPSFHSYITKLIWTPLEVMWQRIVFECIKVTFKSNPLQITVLHKKVTNCDT